MSTGWSIFIIVLVFGNLIGVMWLLLATSSKKQANGSAVESTGHVWDGITELNHPLPKWWFNMFVLTTIFGVGYMFLFPALGNYEGALGWTQLKQLDTQMEQNKASRADYFKQFEELDLAGLQANKQAMATASRLFANNCAQCHGSDGMGSRGFPNLSDNDWLYGNALENVMHSILQGRQGMMPAFKDILPQEQLSATAQYVLSLNNQATDQSKVADVQAVFVVQCAACHGMDGKGNQMLGAPNLTDSTWLYGGMLKDIETTLMLGRSGQMPAHQHLFNEQEAKVLAAYVLAL